MNVQDLIASECRIQDDLYCIYCGQSFPREALVCIDRALDENDQEVPVYSCEACNPVGWKFAKGVQS